MIQVFYGTIIPWPANLPLLVLPISTLILIFSTALYALLLSMTAFSAHQLLFATSATLLST